MLKNFVKLLKESRNNPLKRSILLSMSSRPLGMIFSFFYTPLLLNYLGEESYGIWVTILSVINWINFFDVGIGQGLRNSLAKYVASEDEKRAKNSVSTGYLALASISFFTFIIGTILIALMDISAIFKTDLPIRSVLWVSFFCICINFVLSLSRILLYATQQAEKVGFMSIIIQLINLFGILLLSFFSQGNLLAVAVVIGASGVIVNLVFTRNVWNKYKYLVPNIKFFQTNELKNICNVGIKFFFIQIAALVLYSTDNIVITQLFGPTFVTPYSTSYMAFGIIYGIFSAMLSPLWSRYTVAMEEKDYDWIRKTIISLDKFLPLIALFLFTGSFLFEPISKIWLQKTLTYDTGLVQSMSLYYFIMIWSSIYAIALNGMGKVNMQLALGVITAILNIPLSIFLGGTLGMGTTGVCLATIICMLITIIPITINTHRMLNNLASTSA